MNLITQNGCTEPKSVSRVVPFCSMFLLLLPVFAHGHGLVQALSSGQQAFASCIEALEDLQGQPATKLHVAKHTAVQLRPGLPTETHLISLCSGLCYAHSSTNGFRQILSVAQNYFLNQICILKKRTYVILALEKKLYWVSGYA